MKKTLAVIAVVAIVCAAGSAFAQGQQKSLIDAKRSAQMDQRQEFQRFQAGNSGNCPCFEGRGPRGMNNPSPFDRDNDRRDFGRGERHPRFAPDMPKEIRAKAVELEKLRIDLEEALTARPVNKEKALDVHAKIQNLEKEIENWRFEQRLNFTEKAKIQRELMKRIPPRPAPKPAPKTEAPAPQTEAEVSSEQ